MVSIFFFKSLEKTRERTLFTVELMFLKIMTWLKGNQQKFMLMEDFTWCITQEIIPLFIVMHVKFILINLD